MFYEVKYATNKLPQLNPAIHDVLQPAQAEEL